MLFETIAAPGRGLLQMGPKVSWERFSSMNPPDDLERLVKRCLRHDQAAWAHLIERFQSLVYSIPRRYGLNADDSADVFQATFQALLKNLDRIEDPKTIPKWLAVTSSRESLRIKRISSRSVPAEERGLDLETIVDREEESAEQNAIRAEDADTLRRFTEELDSRCRNLITMLYLADAPSYQEISDELQMPIGAIGPTRARCLEKLRKKLEQAKFFV